LKFSQAVEGIKRGHGKQVDLPHFIDERMWLRKRRASRALDDNPTRFSLSIRLFQLFQHFLRTGDDGSR
jgi:hypothetical protein